MVHEPSIAAAVGEQVRDTVAAMKPKLRGWLHLAMFPLALAGGVLLSVLAPAGTVRIAAIVFAVTASLLFGVSALFHRGTWGPRMYGLLQRLDHSNIYLVIAGTYTPFAVTLLPADDARRLLAVVWTAALLGVVFRVAWIRAPRWLYVGLYIALGWSAVFYVVPFWHTGGPTIAMLLAFGGLCYTAGAVIYGIRRPDPSPRWFGYHELFHAFTLAAFIAHFSAITLAILNHGASVA